MLLIFPSTQLPHQFGQNLLHLVVTEMAWSGPESFRRPQSFVDLLLAFSFHEHPGKDQTQRPDVSFTTIFEEVDLLWWSPLVRHTRDWGLCRIGVQKFRVAVVHNFWTREWGSCSWVSWFNYDKSAQNPKTEPVKIMFSSFISPCRMFCLWMYSNPKSKQFIDSSINSRRITEPATPAPAIEESSTYSKRLN